MTRPLRRLFLGPCLLLVGCVGTAGEAPLSDVEMSSEDRACVDFFYSSSTSIEEEPAYFARLAKRIGELGHEQAGMILDDMAHQWEIGHWEPGPGDEQPEEMISGQMAEAGGLLASEGHIRCADLAEFWGIDGYRGQPTDRDLFDRQREIWTANGVANYRLLLKVPSGSVNPTQYHVEVVDGQPRQVVDALTGEQMTSVPSDIPLNVDQIYDLMRDSKSLSSKYDLVYSVPKIASRISVSFDPYVFPEPQEQFEEP